MLPNIRVANEGTVNSLKVREECIAALEALNKVVSCYRHLAASVGGSLDSIQLRDELRRTRERAQELALTNRNRLTAALRNKELSKEDREDLERLWVQFSSCLELFHTDMCKVYELGQALPLSATHQPAMQTGLTGDTSPIASRALSVPNITYNDLPTNNANTELKELDEEIMKVDQMITDMEEKVNVLRWTVEANTNVNDEIENNEASSVTLLSVEERETRNCCNGGRLIVSLLLCGVTLITVTLSSVL
ncbi:regulator of G-protein signaling 9-binding protein B-like [Spea bombifrons]|uniref:regulator of G-protein signaling 9-binding protein B-like n=1 Tax=Spea bombifrons TaxID=233779 RepID=UPI002349B014|nr:regulator of G-protein signaling 9-binding protein B-like [Spea bombifrons]